MTIEQILASVYSDAPAEDRPKKGESDASLEWFEEAWLEHRRRCMALAAGARREATYAEAAAKKFMKAKLAVRKHAKKDTRPFEALVLYWHEELHLKPGKIAELLGVSVMTASTRLKAAKRHRDEEQLEESAFSRESPAVFPAVAIAAQGEPRS